MSARILVVDDEPVVCSVLKALLEKQGYLVATEASGEDALAALKGNKAELLVADICMDGMDGITLMRQARGIYPGLAVILVTGYASVATGVEAMKLGAFDYIRKPFQYDELVLTVERALTYRQALTENRALKEVLRRGYHFSRLVGDSPRMSRVYRQVEEEAKTLRSVLLVGESGTGKKLLAETLHNAGPRRDGSFLRLNCAVHPDGSLGEELFGDEGAGLFDRARGGTLFLDEIGLLGPALRARLAKALTAASASDADGSVRLVAASIEPPERWGGPDGAQDGLDAELEAVRITVPPLRERLADVPLLVQHFLNRYNQRQECSITVDGAALLAMQDYSWPGNVRELENAVMRAAAACRNERIDTDGLPPTVRDCAQDLPLPIDLQGPMERGRSLRKFLKEKEREYVSYVLQLTDGNKQRAAEMLGISVATLYRKWEKNGDSSS